MRKRFWAWECVTALGMVAALWFGVGATAASESGGKILILTDTPPDDARPGLARSFLALYPGRTQFVDLRRKTPTLDELTEIQFVVTEIREPAHLDRLDRDLLREWARSGKTVISGLSEFAHLHGLKVTLEGLPNRNHIPELLQSSGKR